MDEASTSKLHPVLLCVQPTTILLLNCLYLSNNQEKQQVLNSDSDVNELVVMSEHKYVSLPFF